MSAGADRAGGARRLAAAAARRLRGARASGSRRSTAATWDYVAWLERRLEERAQPGAAAGPAGLFSILTPVYGGSPVGLFRETAASVFGQTTASFEWVVVAQGALPDAVREAVDEVAADERVRCLLKPDNEGIIPGLRAALEAATGDYVIPLDADDLLFPDTLALLAGEIDRRGRPSFVYGDEDAVFDGVPSSPYFRPDWDPLLNLASSYIWHPCAFDRRCALELGVFTDAGSEFCQDWDTVFRFAGAGAEPVHVPEVLYHWTAHGASSTNRPDPHRGSLDSQRHVVQLELERRSLESTFELLPFPLDRGLPELWPRRGHGDAPPASVVVVADDPSVAADCLERVGRSCDHPLQAMAAVDRGGVCGLRRAVADSDAEWTAVFTPQAVPSGADWLWEAVGLGELVPEVGFVSGRLVDARNEVRGGGELWGAGDPCGCPDRGHAAHEPGPYAISLKPHCVSVVNPHFFVARTAVLAEALGDLPDHASSGFLGVWLGMWAATSGVRTAYSPLVAARCPNGFDAAPSADAGERRAVAESFGDIPAAHPLVRLYRFTGGRSLS